ncbi:MAG: DUF4399 domain-containing protein [Gemmatimonadota bacterium]|nr:DUF4399 domain-containing protein [Gemmatimonadota bacterium]
MKSNTLSGRLTAVAGLSLAIALTSCGGQASDEAPSAETAATPSPAAAPDEGPPAVTIDSPADGAVLESANVDVTLSVRGIEIAPVAEGRMETAHHHLFLDVEVTSLDQPVPQDNPQIVHMGDGRSSHTFEGLGPGPHRLIAVLADLGHVPLSPLVSDTIDFRVGG